MEGSYSKVWNAREEAPAEEYRFFVDSLMGTIRCVWQGRVMRAGRRLMAANFHRNEIASCEEAAYDSLPLKDAGTLLFFKSQSELMSFAQQVRRSLNYASYACSHHSGRFPRIAWMGSRPRRINNSVRQEERREDRDPQGEAHSCELTVCA